MDMIIEKKKFVIKDDLLVFTNSAFFSTYFFLIDKKRSYIFPFQKAREDKSTNQVFIDYIPEVEEWKQLFKMLQINSEYDLALYVFKVSKSELINSWEGFLDNFLLAAGYSKGRLNDAEYISNLTELKKEVFIKKGIPVKLLRMTDGQNESLNQKIFQIILIPEINNNNSREILGMWIDLSEQNQEKFINQIPEVIGKIHKDSSGKTGEEIKKLIFNIRFPEYHKRLNHIFELKKKLSPEIKLNFDTLLEKNSLTIYGDIENISDLESFILKLQTFQNKQLIIEILANIK